MSMSVVCKASSKSLVQGARVQRRGRASRSVKVCAKYGEQSKYFDLQDLVNTTGSWDYYGVEDPKRYPSLQEDFFKRSGEPFTRRETLRTFVGVAGIGALATFGAKGAKDAALPITKAPEPSKTENGKGGQFGRL